MLHVVLFQPEIPPNTGNIIRLCANTGARLHLIEPMGFKIDHAKLRRAGLDYHEYARVEVHASLAHFRQKIFPAAIFAFSTKGKTRYDQIVYPNGAALLFGPETRGLPGEVLDQFPEEQRACLPMTADSRSLNLSNTVAIAVYEVWRQNKFAPIG